MIIRRQYQFLSAEELTFRLEAVIMKYRLKTLCIRVMVVQQNPDIFWC